MITDLFTRQQDPWRKIGSIRSNLMLAASAGWNEDRSLFLE
jgi:hypothetical protein